MRYSEAEKLIHGEYLKSGTLHPKFNSAHEGLAIIEEEFLEFREEVFKNPNTRDFFKMRKEATQLAAMCLRFITEVKT